MWSLLTCISEHIQYFIKMANILLLAITMIAAVQSAVMRDISLKRKARSPCPACDGLPPPPLLHTQNWSGLARTADGLQNTVFSGAAAAAEPGARNAGEAFSLASSAVNNQRTGLSAGQSYGYDGSVPAVKDPLPNNFNNNFASTHSSNGNYKISDESYKESSKSHTPYQGETTRDFTYRSDISNTGFDSGTSSEKSRSFDNNVQNDKYTNNKLQEISRGDIENEQSSGYEGFENQQPSFPQRQPIAYNGNNGQVNNHQLKYVPSKQYNNGNNYVNGRSLQPREYQDQQGFGSSQSTQYEGIAKSQFRDNSLQSAKNGIYNIGTQKDYQQPNAQAGRYSSESAAGGRVGQHETGANNFDLNKHQEDESFVRRGTEPESEDSSEEELQNAKRVRPLSALPNSPISDAGSALKGALDLSFQGLQAARQAECSTCGKNSYAFSKAKSYSGSAIALSIGG